MKRMLCLIMGWAVLWLGACAPAPQFETAENVGDVASPPADSSSQSPPDASGQETPTGEQAAEEQAGGNQAESDDTQGIAVGQSAPPFELKDQKDQTRTLDEFRQAGNVALVFYRSADW